MTNSIRCAAITLYYKETRHLLECCISSVARQSVKTDHFLISDGFSQDWIDATGVRHIRLGKGHADYGNTPRGLGALLAASEGYDAVFFLDADNWIEPNHAEACVDAAVKAFGTTLDCDCVFARRLFKRFDETTMPIAEHHDHVDTNCYFFFPGAYHLLSIWVTLPQYLSAQGDRFFNKVLRARGLRTAATHVPTVNYHCAFASLYRTLGETPPLGAKENIIDDFDDKIRSLSPRQLEVLFRLSGGLRFSH